MPVDASIPLSGKQFDFKEGVSLQNLARQSRLQDYKIQDAEEERRQRNALKQILADPSSIDPQTQRLSPIALGKVTQVSPEMGMQLGHQQEQLRLQDLKFTEEKTNLALRVEQSYVETYDRALHQTNGNKVEALRIAQTARNEAIDELEKTGSLRAAGFSQQEIERARQMQRHPDMARAIITAQGGKGAESVPLSDIGKLKSDLDRGKISKPDYDAEVAKKTSANSDAPSGYRKTASGNLEFIPGGPADPDKKTGSLGNRESVFINRVMLSANEAAKDLDNVVRLPTTASRGIFGGRQQGPSLFEAGKETLANKMTTQEVQSYNVRSAGFQRSLAAIEAAGLAPSGTLSHQMDAVLFKEGDTNLTKLEKLAQTRQIIEAGLETTVSNPKLAKSQRDHIDEVIKSIRKAVPFTIEDIDRLEAAQQDNPNATLKDIMPKAESKSDGPKEGDKSKSKSGKPIVFKNGNWEYE